MTRRRPNDRAGSKRKGAGLKLPRLGTLVGGGLLIGAIGFVVLLVVYGVMGEGGPKEGSAEVKETKSEDSGEPFAAGPRLHFPVDAIDMGYVTLNTNVSYAFAMTNVGSDAAHIEDVDVSVLEGCWPFEPVVSSTTLEPGQESEISFTTHMMEGMDGPHLFEITVRSDDPVEPLQKLQVKAEFGP